MKIVITDYPEVLTRNVEYEKALLQSSLPDARICVVPYLTRRLWLEQVADADGIITAFLTIDEEIMKQMPALRCISVNASGYDNIAVEAASERKIIVAAVREYCTQEVAEHTLALMLALGRRLKHYSFRIDREKQWRYTSASGIKRMEGQTLGICGYGRIGSAVAKRAAALGMHIIAYSPHISAERAREEGVEAVDKRTLLERSDVITNHMAQTAANYHFFDQKAFRQMKRQPIFINVGRGGAVDEAALCEALELGYISAAGLDVLESENPVLETNPLVGRENVILTPHAAFYSEDSIRLLQEISCRNLVSALQGEYDQMEWFVNQINVRG